MVVVGVGGVVEFSGLEAGPSNPPINVLRRKVSETFPNMTVGSEGEWLGFGSSPTDSLPLIGEVGNSGVYAAFWTSPYRLDWRSENRAHVGRSNCRQAPQQ